MRVRPLSLSVLAGSVTLVPSAAYAVTSASFQVSAIVVSGCEINGDLATGGELLGRVGTIDFGTHSALATGNITANMVQNSALTLSCTPGVALTMSLNGGLHATSSRNLQASGSAATIPYRLYRDAGLNQEFTINQAVSVTFADPQSIALPVYGQITLSGDKPPDTYSDTILLTLSW